MGLVGRGELRRTVRLDWAFRREKLEIEPDKARCCTCMQPIVYFSMANKSALGLLVELALIWKDYRRTGICAYFSGIS